MPRLRQSRLSSLGAVDGRLWESAQKLMVANAQGTDHLPQGDGVTRFSTDALINRSGSLSAEIYVPRNKYSDGVLAELQGLNFQIVGTSLQLEQSGLLAPADEIGILGWLDPANLEALARSDWLAYINGPDIPESAIGDALTEGDAIHRADDLRAGFAHMGIDGSGMTVGVISLRAANYQQSVASGDLPADVLVNGSLPQLQGDNEGTAMMEIVYDLAPGADLLFSSGYDGRFAFALSVDWMITNGADVIVDDLLYFDQPFFEDGFLAGIVQTAIDNGVVFVSSAGNQVNHHWQGQFEDAGFGFLDFVPGAGTDDDLSFTIPAGKTALFTLQWSDPFGQSGNDYNLHVFDNNGNQVAASQGEQSGTQDPVEQVAIANVSGSTQVAHVVVLKLPSALPRRIEIHASPTATIVDGNQIAADAIFGHQAVLDNIVTAAINANDPGNDTVAPYSSNGPSTIFTDFGSQTSTARNSLDGAGIDRVQTEIGQDGLFPNPFFGTSAAAPHIAGIAALLKDARASLTPQQVASALTTSAIDVEATGYDQRSGYGRFDAWNAILELRLWQNPACTLDVNDDGLITAQDALLISNLVNRNGGNPIPLPDPGIGAPPPYLDVDGNNIVSSDDGNEVTDYLNTNGAGPC